jgi:predicted GNAT family acetyltransferase
MATAVEHQEKQHRFVVNVDGHEGELTYKLQGDVIIFDHTAVAPEIQHQGHADRLAEAALAYAKEMNLKVDPQCRFMEVYIQRHRQYDSMLVGKASADHPPRPMAGGNR